MTEENRENVSVIHLYSLSKETEINFSKSEIADYSLMLGDMNNYNPVKEWLNNTLQGEDKAKKGYIRKYFECLVFDDEEETNKEMYLTLFTKWLVQCVAMQFNELKSPSGADGALGLQSKNEAIGKTSFFRNLCFDPRYFKDGISLDPKNKDSVRIATSFWICELGEVESSLSKDLAMLKAFITEDYDIYRIPFATAPTTKPRRTSFCFTCNSDKFLKEGDNRRFWTIPITDVDLKTLKTIDIGLLWGETYALYLQDPQGYRLTQEERNFLKSNNKEKFGFRVNEEEVLRDKLDFTIPLCEWKYMTATDISDAIFGDRNHSRIIGKILTEKLGYDKSKSVDRHYRISRGMKEYNIPQSFAPKTSPQYSN